MVLSETDEIVRLVTVPREALGSLLFKLDDLDEPPEQIGEPDWAPWLQT